jgi:hypothetical protein
MRKSEVIALFALGRGAGAGSPARPLRCDVPRGPGRARGGGRPLTRPRWGTHMATLREPVCRAPDGDARRVPPRPAGAHQRPTPGATGNWPAQGARQWARQATRTVSHTAPQRPLASGWRPPACARQAECRLKRAGFFIQNGDMWYSSVRARAAGGVPRKAPRKRRRGGGQRTRPHEPRQRHGDARKGQGEAARTGVSDEDAGPGRREGA